VVVGDLLAIITSFTVGEGEFTCAVFDTKRGSAE
jgi:hypothetical protein